MYSFGNLGIVQAMAYHAAKRIYPRERLWTFGVFFALVWGPILGLIGLLVIFLLPQQILHLDNLGKIFITLAALTISTQLISGYLRYYLLGYQEFRLFNISDILKNLLAAGISVGLLFVLKNKLLAIYLAWLTVQFVNMSYLILITKQPWSLPRMFIKGMLVENLKYGFKVYATNLLQFLNYRLDQFVLNYFLGSGQVGLYSVAVGLGEYVWQISDAVQTILFPKVASTSESSATIMTARVNRNTLLMTAITALFLGVFGYWLIYFLYGSEFLPSYSGLLWLLPGIVAFTVVKILYSDLAGRGHPEIGSYITGGAVIATLIFDFLLIPKGGLVGAAQASTLAYTVSAIFCVIVYINITKVNILLLLIPQREDFQAYLDIMKNVLTKKVKVLQKPNGRHL